MAYQKHREHLSLSGLENASEKAACYLINLLDGGLPYHTRIEHGKVKFGNTANIFIVTDTTHRTIYIVKKEESLKATSPETVRAFGKHVNPSELSRETLGNLLYSLKKTERPNEATQELYESLNSYLAVIEMNDQDLIKKRFELLRQRLQCPSQASAIEEALDKEIDGRLQTLQIEEAIEMLP